MLNYVVNYSRDDPIVVQEGSAIGMTGPKRGIEWCSVVLVEFDTRIKNGTREGDDQQLIASRQIKFEAKLYGCASRGIKLKLASISWSKAMSSLSPGIRTMIIMFG